MRCPKCGYISFDHVEVCGKCSKDLTGVVEKLGGGQLAVDSPQFLVLETEEDQFDEEGLSALNFSDEDGRDDDEIDALLADVSEEDDESIISLSGDDDEGFDFSFDDDELSLLSEQEEISLPVPDELSDMSDLAPQNNEESDEDEDREIEFDFSSDNDAEDLGTISISPVMQEEEEYVIDKSEALVSHVEEEFEFSLEEDFSDTEKSVSSSPVSVGASVNMDEELDFDLDLDGLELHKKEEKI